MRKKILFVTHALESPYGAATSLRLLLENYDDVEADIIVPRSFRRSRDLSALAARFPGVRQIYELSVPIDLGVVGMTRSLSEKIHGVVHELSWLRDRTRYHQILAANRYDLVHLNSVVLHKMTVPTASCVTHVREIIPDLDSPVITKLANGAGLLFIDAATRKAFARYEGAMQATTINNPIDMRQVADIPSGLKHLTINPSVTLFSIIGRVSALKGIDLVISAFREGAGPNARLLIVGDGPADYVAHCRAIAGGDPRIIFWGEEGDIAKVYAATDYVVRGDPQPCVGRTVYEGLYAGCRVIMPGPGSPDLIFEAEKFQHSICWYAPGSKAALASLFADGSSKKVGVRHHLSNIESYVTAFDDFMNACLERRRQTP